MLLLNQVSISFVILTFLSELLGGDVLDDAHLWHESVNAFLFVDLFQIDVHDKPNEFIDVDLLHEWIKCKDGDTEGPADNMLVGSELGCSGDLWTKSIWVFTNPKDQELERKFSEEYDPEDTIVKQSLKNVELRSIDDSAVNLIE